MNRNINSKERLALRALCEIVNSNDFKKIFAKAQIKVSRQKPLDINITFEEILDIFTKASEIDDDNVDTDIVPKNFIELMPYLFADISYEKAAKIAESFIETNIANMDTPLMNRGNHTLVVAILSILTAKKIYLSRYDTIMTGIIALSHDIGHFPFAHITEEAIAIFQEYLNSYDQTAFTHEKLSAKVVNAMLQNAQDDIINDEINVLRNKISLAKTEEEKAKLTNELNSVTSNYEQIMNTIRDGQLSHSNSRHPETPESIPAQIVRIMDKVAYVIHDLIDGIKEGVITEAEIEKAITVDAEASIKEKLSRTGETFSKNRFERLSYKMLKLPPVKKMMFCVEKMHLINAYDKNIAGMDPYLWRMINKSLKHLTRRKINSKVLNKNSDKLEKLALFAGILMFEQIKQIYKPFIKDSNSKEINDKIMNIVVDNLRTLTDFELYQYVSEKSEEAKKLSETILGARNSDEAKTVYSISNALEILIANMKDGNRTL